jgi:TonB family protein
MSSLWIVGLFALLVASPIVAQDLVYRAGPQITEPKALVMPAPKYTQAAMLRRISGNVELEVDVRPDGSVGAVALVKSLWPELDESAAQTAKEWKFTPGLKDGVPVTVRTTITLTFSMREPVTRDRVWFYGAPRTNAEKVP